MRNEDKSVKLKWIESLEKKEKKIKKKDIEFVMSQYIKREITGTPHTIFATNFLGNEIQVVCPTRDECLENIATLNGFTLDIKDKK